MSKTQEERVEHALSQLLERILPTYPDEDEVAADERFEDAFNLAIEAIGRQGLQDMLRHGRDVLTVLQRRRAGHSARCQSCFRFDQEGL